jgi:hypothetical protein
MSEGIIDEWAKESMIEDVFEDEVNLLKQRIREVIDELSGRNKGESPWIWDDDIKEKLLGDEVKDGN